MLTMNTLLVTFSNYFDSIVINGCNIFETNLLNTLIFTVGLLFLLGSLFVVHIDQRIKATIQEYEELDRLKEKLKKLTLRMYILSHKKKRERVTSILEEEDTYFREIKNPNTITRVNVG
jgi:hypothetical protein